MVTSNLTASQVEASEDKFLKDFVNIMSSDGDNAYDLERHKPMPQREWGKYNPPRAKVSEKLQCERCGQEAHGMPAVLNIDFSATEERLAKYNAMDTELLEAMTSILSTPLPTLKDLSAREMQLKTVKHQTKVDDMFMELFNYPAKALRRVY